MVPGLGLIRVGMFYFSVLEHQLSCGMFYLWYFFNLVDPVASETLSSIPASCLSHRSQAHVGHHYVEKIRCMILLLVSGTKSLYLCSHSNGAIVELVTLSRNSKENLFERGTGAYRAEDAKQSFCPDPCSYDLLLVKVAGQGERVLNGRGCMAARHQLKLLKIA